jgi:hypothetical protein
MEGSGFGAVLKVLISNYPPAHMLLRLRRNSICAGGNLINSTFQTAPTQKAFTLNALDYFQERIQVSIGRNAGAIFIPMVCTANVVE